MQAVILSGGLGTRLGELTKSTPKPMVEAAGRPFLEHEIEMLKRSGIDDIVLCVGYLGDKIVEHFGDGKKSGVRMRYSFDGPELLGPAGALKRASSLLNETFFVTYGDAYLRLDCERAMDRLLYSKVLGLMTVFRNDGRHGKSDLVVKGGRVVAYDKSGKTPGMRWINYGVSALRRDALELIPAGRFCGEEEFYGKLIRREQLLAFAVRKRFYEIGTPDSLEEFSRFISRRSH